MNELANHRTSRGRFLPTVTKQRDAEIVRIVSERVDGIKAVEIASILKIRPERVLEALRRISISYGVATTHPNGGGGARWTTPERVEALRESMKAGLTADYAKRLARQKSRPAGYSKPEIVDDGEPTPPFVHLLVSAIEAKPLRKLGPASVWELALEV